MNTSSEESFDVVVVGAGWNGLIAASTYLRLAPETSLIILDNGQSVGGVWSQERIYPNLFAQVGHGLFEYSSYPMKKEGLTPDRYIGGQTIHDYLRDFARDHDLNHRLRFNTTVTKVQKTGDGGWRLGIANAPSISCKKLIYASGASSGAYIPPWPREQFIKPIIHSSEVGISSNMLEGPSVKRAIVVGAAKSSYDTVFLLLKAGKKVDWIIRDDGSGPLAIMPPRLLGFLNAIDVMATRAMACFSPAILSTKGLGYKFLHRTRLGRAVTKAFWRTLTTAAEWHAGYSKSENARKLMPIPPSSEDFGTKWRKLDALGELKVNELFPILANPPDTEKATSERRPWRLYRLLVSPTMAAEGDRSIYFPGQIHTVYTPLVAEMQALWGAAFLLGYLQVPDQDEMEEEVAVWNAWTRKRYLDQGRKHAYSIYDHLAYIDTLARDLGVRTQRKSNPISEILSPYRPGDYRGLIDEYLSRRVSKPNSTPGRGVISKR